MLSNKGNNGTIGQHPSIGDHLVIGIEIRDHHTEIINIYLLIETGTTLSARNGLENLELLGFLRFGPILFYISTG